MNQLRQFFRNISEWWRGYRRFDRIKFKEGWNGQQWRWRLLYTFDYGPRVATGGACVSWSRWWFDMSERYLWAAAFTAILNKFDPRHGEDAGRALWDTEDCAPWVRFLAWLFWIFFWLTVVRMIRWWLT